MERKAEHDITRKLKVYLQRYHDIKVSRHGCYQVLKRNRLNRLPENIKKAQGTNSRVLIKKYQAITCKLM